MKFHQQNLGRLTQDRSDSLRAILVYGPDAGHVEETATEIARSAVENLSDPFSVVLLTDNEIRQDAALLFDAATAMSLTQGKRLIRVRDASDGLAQRFQDIAELPRVDALTVVEAGALEPRSKLRQLFETSDVFGAIACYGDDGPGLAAFVRRTLGELDVILDPESLEYLVENLGGDRRHTRSELEKLALFLGAGCTATLENVQQSIGDSGLLAMEDIAYAAADGDAAALEASLHRASATGESPVRVVRVAIGHFQRLHQAALALEAGVEPESAIGSLRPPIFRNRRARFESQLYGWQVWRLEAALDRLFEAEFRCKSTGIPDQAVCAQSLIGVCLFRASNRTKGRIGFD
ncbi:MAG: DNA polymerase III subunit delta [Rhodospirillaceae bacterium]|nr:DNA polymerase III subunit delta [Rhodospirillaceae bacterium]